MRSGPEALAAGPAFVTVRLLRSSWRTPHWPSPAKALPGSYLLRSHASSKVGSKLSGCFAKIVSGGGIETSELGSGATCLPMVTATEAKLNHFKAEAHAEAIDHLIAQPSPTTLTLNQDNFRYIAIFNFLEHKTIEP